MSLALVDAPSIGGPEAARRAGISYRQLDHWLNTGLALGTESTGSGHRRRFTEQDVTVLRVLGRLAELMPAGRNADTKGPILNRVARIIVNYPAVLDRPMLFITPTGLVSTTPKVGWCVEVGS